MIRVGIIGAEGRMGQRIIQRIQTSSQLKLTAALTEEKSFNVGKDAGFELGFKSGVKLSSDIRSILGDAPIVDVMIDFSTPLATIESLPFLWDAGIPIIIGTRGFSEEQEGVIYTAAHQIPVLMSRNASIGIHLIYTFLKRVSKLFNEQIHFEITEDTESLHDKPSDITTQMARTILQGRDIDYQDSEVNEKLASGQNYEQISYKKVGKSDDNKGHRVKLVLDCEEITISHKICDYNIYVDGALWSAVWLSEQRPGFYEMSDIMDSYMQQFYKKH